MFTKILIANRGDDPGADEVRLARRRRAEVHRLVGETDVARARVGVGIDGDGRDAHAPRRLDAVSYTHLTLPTTERV